MVLAAASGSLVVARPASAATLRVTTATDELATGNEKCSLREAIATVNSPGRSTSCGTAHGRSNTIVLGRGAYVLSIAPQGRDGNSSGDLDITTAAPLTIRGIGTELTRITASGLGDRVLSVAGGARVTLDRLRLSGGHAPGALPGSVGLPGVACLDGGSGGHGYDSGTASDGGGIYNAGTLTLNRVSLTGNTAGTGGAGGAGGKQAGAAGCIGGDGGAGGSGGGIYNQGTLTVNGSTIQANTGGSGGPGGVGGASSHDVGGTGGRGGAGGAGGGIYNQGTLSVSSTTLNKNHAGAGGGGGAGGAGGDGGAASGTGGAGGAGAPGGGLDSLGGRLTVTNSTLVSNLAGGGGTGGSPSGSGGSGGDGGGVAVRTGGSALRNDTLDRNGTGAGGPSGSPAGHTGPSGFGGGVFVRSVAGADAMHLQNTIVAFSRGAGCAGSGGFAIVNAGHDLSYGDRSCPGVNGNPRLGQLGYNGGPTQTVALNRGSAAINRVPLRGAGCPSRDQRSVRRPEGRGCDIGAYEFAVPSVIFISPSPHGSYERGSRLVVRFRCTEGGLTSLITSCHGSVSEGRRISTAHPRRGRLVVTAADTTGHRTRSVVRYSVWIYVNPMRKVAHLRSERIDMGVDYAGSGPLLAIGRGRVTVASNRGSGSSPHCRGITCWIGGGALIYRLLDGPFAGKSVYIAENIRVTVHAGQIVRAGQRVAILRPAQPNMEIGWASRRGAETLAVANHQQCPCGDPGGWSTIEGRNFNAFLVRLGATAGHVQPNPPRQSMPRGWPTWRRRHHRPHAAVDSTI